MLKYTDFSNYKNMDTGKGLTGTSPNGTGLIFNEKYQVEHLTLISQKIMNIFLDTDPYSDTDSTKDNFWP